MFEIATLAIIGYLAAGSDTKRVSGDIYTQKSTLVEKSSIPKDYSLTKTYVPSLVLWDNNSTRVSQAQNVISNSFNEIDLPIQDGLYLLEINKKFLASSSFVVRRIEPVISFDSEEDNIYLNIRLYIEANFERTLELDYLMTKNLVKSTQYIPEKLSFTVHTYEAV
ncbi:MAG: hypothetical protein PHO76_08335 [Methylotenera sp.]|nr:hypothetical protein [Methylotenera sp.]MDD4926435.1 hypothetical protein [Methylotenera sp.]